MKTSLAHEILLIGYFALEYLLPNSAIAKICMALLGPKVNGNPYKLKDHIWIPFETFAQKHLRYKSWGKYPKDFQTISNWFENDLIPLYASMIHGEDGRNNGFVEGVIFLHPDGRMAKLRRDMFGWFKGTKHKE